MLESVVLKWFDEEGFLEIGVCKRVIVRNDGRIRVVVVCVVGLRGLL